MWMIPYLLIGILGGAGGYTIGIFKMANENINQKLIAIHASEINNVLLQGGSGYSLNGRVMIGGTGIGGSVVRTGDSVKVKYTAGGGYFEVGYIPTSMRCVYPVLMLGIGGFSEELVISRLTRRSDWESIWQDPANETVLKHGGFSLSPSLALLFISTKIPLGLMFKITYNTILTKKWEFDDGTVLTSYPDSPSGSVSFTLTILGKSIKKS